MASEEKVPDKTPPRVGEPPDDGRSDHNERHSVFTTAEKWCIVSMVSFAAWFSTLSSFIYYPAIPALTEALDISVSKVNLTVTVYMAVASISPALVGDTADILGRRPVYVLTLSTYFVANIAIALTKTYPALLGLRVLQALSISVLRLIILKEHSQSPMGSSQTLHLLPNEAPLQLWSHSRAYTGSYV